MYRKNSDCRPLPSLHAKSELNLPSCRGLRLRVETIFFSFFQIVASLISAEEPDSSQSDVQVPCPAITTEPIFFPSLEWEMPEIQLGAHTIRSHGAKVARIHMHDWLVLLFLIIMEVVLNVIEPFHRFVGEEMMEDLKYPLQENTIPLWAVPIIAILLPLAVILIYYFVRKDVYDLHQAVLGLLFSVLVTGVLTDAIKDAVGRPRPDFFWRCFPDGKGVSSQNLMVLYPFAGSFAGLGFLSWYMAGKVRVFDQRGHVAKLCIVIFPLLVAALVGVSRVDDYWHHWQDVFAGGLLGITVASFCYLQFFPPPYDIDEVERPPKKQTPIDDLEKEGWGPHMYFQMLSESRNDTQPSNINGLNVAPLEIENVLIQSRSGMAVSDDSIHNTNSILNEMERGRRH
ncbi:Phosphatidic acid phosphatase/chloroperoxidase, N-terminal [Cynara cardunculus var. scolymus]|uniref:Phosphatidic acid phosphatase/chloroperoxidase, N-terminal n=1 Tax=Cynara cardunculus var. scolymus TaxID=59895 RepID=A0A103XSX3_CYNCS|nr:Phosphatidic acid phosphatase/chloroperoxidase, N-terminal [Cynara cardunculus var. scolymus]